MRGAPSSCSPPVQGLHMRGGSLEVFTEKEPTRTPRHGSSSQRDYFRHFPCKEKGGEELVSRSRGWGVKWPYYPSSLPNPRGSFARLSAAARSLQWRWTCEGLMASLAAERGGFPPSKASRSRERFRRSLRGAGLAAAQRQLGAALGRALAT